jgi:hypothetical protein
MSRSIDGIFTTGKNQPPLTVRPFDFGTDAIERQRVSLGVSLIDADFEYGLQATKWQSFTETRKTPSFYEVPGSDIAIASVVTDTGVPATITVTMGQLGSARIVGPTAGGSLQSSLAVTFTSGSVAGTVANNQFVLGLAAYIPTGPIYISALTTTTCTLNFPSQTITSIPDTTQFTTVAPVPAVSTLAAPSVVSVYGLANDAKNADRAEGYFLVTSSTLTASVAQFTYVAKGSIAQVPSSTISTAFTTVRKGGVYNNGGARIQVSGYPIQTQYPTNTVTVQTSTTHGLVPGTAITVIGWTNGSGVNGNFFVDSVPTVDTFTYTPTGSTSVLLTGTGAIYVQPYSSITHRPFDGGVILTVGQSSHGSNICRQSKKVFRYQSGKGLLWSSGTLFCPNNDIVRMTVSQTITTVLGTVRDACLTTRKQFYLTSSSGFAVNQTLTNTSAQALGFDTVAKGTVAITAIAGTLVTVSYISQIHGVLTGPIGTGIIFATSAASTTTASLPIDVTPTTSKVYGVYSTAAITQPVTTATGADTVASVIRTITMTNTTGLLAGQTVTSLSAYIPVGVVTIQSVTGGSITISYQAQIVPVIPTSAVVTVNSNPFGRNQYLTLGAYSLGILQGDATITDVTGTSITVSYASQTITAQTLATSIQVASVPAGSIVTVVTEVPHGAAMLGANITIRGVSTPGYNGDYQIDSVVESTTFTFRTIAAQRTASPTLSDQPRFIVNNWHGASVRAGCFDDQNGLFWEFDGQTLWCVKRSSTFQLAGLVTVNVNSQTLTGIADSAVTTAVISAATPSADITFGETTVTLTGITLSGGTLYRGMQCSSLTNATQLGVVSVQRVLSATSAVVTFLPYIVTAKTALSTTTSSSGTVSACAIAYTTYNNFVNGMTITNLAGYITGTVTLSLVTSTTAQLNFTAQVINNIPAGFVIQAFSPILAATSVSGQFINVGTRFQDQLRAGDRFVLRGMTHTVTNIISQGVITFNPPYRGSQNITVGTKISKVKEQRTPQSQFSRDTIDGSGPSGFSADLTKMQMIGLQYTWYGAGFIDFMMRGGDGNWVYAHRYKQNNVNDEAYMRTGNMPVRYEIVNEATVASSSLSQKVAITDTTLNIGDDPTYWPSFGTVQIDNELISYTGKDSFRLTGCTRASNLTYNIADIRHVFTGAPQTTHSANTSVTLVSTTCTPSLTHWGSALLMDGNFDSDRGYYFNYQFNNTTTLSVGANPLELFFLRLAPSVSNGIIGDIGIRDLLNRAQFLLQQLDVSAVGSNGTVNIQAILNPSGFEASTFNWVPINSTGQGSQPSFTQVAVKPPTGSYVIGSGERIFSMIASGGTSSTIDLTALKELTNSLIGGSRMFPDGPDTLMIIAQAFNSPITTSVVNLFWSEAQA